MKHLKKYNEGSEEPMMDHSYTWDELLYRIETGECKLVRCEKKNITEYLEEMGTDDRLSEIGTSPIEHGQWGANQIDKTGILTIDQRFVVVFGSDRAPIAIITQYEISNPIVFGDVVVVPGHDSITCYNKVTGEEKTGYIR